MYQQPANITCLHKKGPFNIAKNYRGLSIGANMTRILANIVMLRLNEAYETNIDDSQFGFGRNRSATDADDICAEVCHRQVQ